MKKEFFLKRVTPGKGGFTFNKGKIKLQPLLSDIYAGELLIQVFVVADIKYRVDTT